MLLAVPESYVPDERERRVANALGTILPLAFFVTLIASNITGNWWPLALDAAAVVVAVVSTTAWIARSRDWTMRETVRQVLRSGPKDPS